MVIGRPGSGIKQEDLSCLGSTLSFTKREGAKLDVSLVD